MAALAELEHNFEKYRIELTKDEAPPYVTYPYVLR
jgi:hypothetical protein